MTGGRADLGGNFFLGGWGGGGWGGGIRGKSHSPNIDF